MPQPPGRASWSRPRYCLESITNTPPGPITKWSRLAWLPGRARSCRTAQPWHSSAAKSRAVRRSPAAPRRQAMASGLGRNRSPQPAATAASTPRTSPSRGASRLPRTPPPDPHQRWRPPATAGRASRRPTRSPAPAATAPGRSRLAGPRWPGPAPPPPADRHRCRPAALRDRRCGGPGRLEVGLAERPHRPAGPVLVVEGLGLRTGHWGRSFWWC